MLNYVWKNLFLILKFQKQSVDSIIERMDSRIDKIDSRQNAINKMLLKLLRQNDIEMSDDSDADF